MRSAGVRHGGGNYMKGILFQVGDPKSIVLLNNGKFDVIDTPPNAKVGMLVTIKRTKRRIIMAIIIIGIAAVIIGAVFCALHFGFFGEHECLMRGHHHGRAFWM
jgi:hypothetical protein